VTLSRPAITALLAEHGLHPSRALGQNFVADPNTVRRIVRLAGVGAGTPVVEIGAGLGSLTLALAETGAAVVAVEVDRYLVPVLREVLAGTDVDVVEGDALTLDWGSLLARDPGPWSLVANLPYNVAVPVTIGVLERAPMVASLLVMVQREVGERMAARAGEDAYGAVSVKVDYWSRAEVVGRVPATVFVPRPNVESVLVRLERAAPRRRPVARQLRPPLLGCARRVRAAPQDAATLARCHRRSRGLRGGRRRTRGACRGARRRPVGPPRRLGAPVVIGARPERVGAPAKLTVSLAVTGRRPDGYHELEAEMVAIDLADELLFVDGGSGLEIEADPSARAEGLERGPGNLVTRALELLGRPATVVLRKRIPVQGGLGGGSTDAAAVLRWRGARTWTWPPHSAVTSPSAWSAAVRWCAASASRSRASSTRPARSSCWCPPSGWTRPRSIVPTTNWGSGARANVEPTDRRRPRGRTETRRLARHARCRDRCGAHLAGSGSTWFAEGTLESLGLTGRDELEWGAERARLYEVATVPSGWELPTVP